MPKLLSPEEIAARYSQGYRAEPTEQSGALDRIGTAFGDRAVAGLAGIGEAMGLDLGQYRREQQYDNQLATQRYFRDNPNQPRTWDEVQGIGDAARFTGGLFMDSAPELATSLAALPLGAAAGLGALGRTALGAGLNYPAALGDILQGQREEAGRTSLVPAATLAAPYAAVDMLGLEGALASGRLYRSGIRQLDELQGVRGVAARTGASALKAAPIEAGTEVFQTGMGELGRMAVSRDASLFSDEAMDRYGDAAIGGALMGGAAGGALGGWRRSEGYMPPVPPTVDEGQYDLTQRPRYNLVTQFDPLQARIDQQLGLTRQGAPKDYAKIFETAASEGSGIRVAGPDGIERELTAQEALELGLPPAAPTTEAAPAEQKPASKVFSEDELFLMDRGVTPRKKGLELLAEARNMGLDLESDALTGFWTSMAENKFGQAKKALAEAVVEQRANNASAQVVPADTAAAATAAQAPGVQANGQAAQAAAAATGAPAATAPGASASGATRIVTPKPGAVNGPEATQTVEAKAQGPQVLPAAGQPAPGAAASAVEAAGVTPVDSGAPVDIVKRRKRVVVPAQPATAYVAPEAPAVGVKTEDRAEIEQMTGNAGDASAFVQEDTGRRSDGADADSTLRTILAARFKGSATADRDIEIATAYLTAMRNAPKGSKVKIQEAIGQKYGVGAQAVRKIGNTTKLVEAGAALGYKEAEVRQLFEVTDNTKGDTPAAPAESDSGEQLTAAMQAAGVDTADGESLGFGYDDARFWAAPETTAEAKAEAVNSIMERQEKLRELISEYEEQGQLDAVEALQDQITALDAQLTAAMDAYRDYLEGKKPATKAAEKPTKKAKATEADPWAGVKRTTKGEVEMVPTAALDGVSQRNKASTKTAEYKALKASIEANGIVDPIVLTLNSMDKPEVFEGNHRLQVARELGIKEIPVVLHDRVNASESVPLAGRKPSSVLPDVEADTRLDREKARDAWDAEASTYDGAPLFDELTPDQQDRWVEYGEGNWEPSDVATELARIQREGGFENLDRFSTATPTYILNQRNPSLRRQITALQKQLDQGLLTPEAFAARVELAMLLSERQRDVKPRERGADYIRQRLLEAKRRGELSQEAVDMAEWFILRNPALVDDLGISIRSSKEDGASGSYEPLTRVMTLIKGSGNNETTVHEILHHLERMMPEQVQAAIRKSWLKSMATAAKVAEKKGDKQLQAYYKALFDFHLGGDTSATQTAMRLLKDGVVGYEHYQHFNASEFWAVNGSRIMQGRFEAKGSVLQRLKTWLREFAQKIKGMFGLQSDAPLLKALDSLSKGDGKFVGKYMLANSPTGYKMFAGRQAMSSDQVPDSTTEKLMTRLSAAIVMKSAGESNEEIWRQTGWEKNPDGRWRFEISDADAKFKTDFATLEESKAFDTKREYKLSEVLDHPTLFKYYPELADVKFIKNAPFLDFGRSIQGWFSDTENTIAVTPYAQNPLSTLLHEVQHWVQNKERFAPGGNVESTALTNKEALEKLYKLLAESRKVVGSLDATKDKVLFSVEQLLFTDAGKDITAAQRRIDELEKKVAEANRAQKELDEQIQKEIDASRAAAEKSREEINQKIKALEEEIAGVKFATPEWSKLQGQVHQLRMDRLDLIGQGGGTIYDDKFVARREAAQAAVNEAETNLKAATDDMRFMVSSKGIAASDVQYFMYRLISGETEARNTQRRQGMSALDRRRVAPENTADVPYDYQVVPKRDAQPAAFMNVERPSPSTVQKNLAKLPKQAQGPARNSLRTMSSWSSKALDRVVFTSDLIDRAVKAGVPAARKFADLIARRSTSAREMERDVERVADMFALVPADAREATNQFLFDSTRAGKWPYGKNADQEFADRYNALPKEARAFVKAVFDHGAKTLALKKQAVLDYTASEYDALIAAAQKTGDLKEAGKLQREKAADIRKYESLFSVREGIPYAPIKRVGDFVVIAKSAEYVAAEQADDKAQMRKLEADENHYRVTFKDTLYAANQLADQYRANGFASVGASARLKAQEQFFQGSEAMTAVTKLQELAKTKGDAKLQGMVKDILLQTLADNSARKSEMRRRNIAGEVDMLQSFAIQGKADAQFRASVQFNQPTSEAMQEMFKQARTAPDRNRANEVVDELNDRYQSSLQFEPQPWLNKLNRLTSIYFLATSPAYYLQNMTQPWMMSLPAMAGRFDYTKAAAMLGQSYGELKDVMKSAKLFEQGFDFSKVPADVRGAINELANRGRIDIGLDTELGEFQIAETGKVTGAWNRIDKGMRMLVQKGEAINRLTTAMTAYRLAKQAGESDAGAIDYAERILSETHGDYGSFNAPKYFNTTLGKIALQFRKFQLIQISFYAKLIRDAYEGNDRKAALKTLAYALGHTGLLAGAVGMPGYAAIAWVLGKALGDEDEPYDLTFQIRKAIGNEDVANLVLRGAPTLAGVDISGKVGAGNMLSIMPFSNADMSTPQGRAEALGTLLGGASMGLANRLVDGLGLMLEGQWLRGLEYALPKGLGDAIKAARINEEGMTRRNGDVILPANEVSAVESIIQAIGFLPADQSVVYERRQRSYEMDNRMQQRSKTIKQEYTKAVKERDTEAMQQARREWQQLQETRKRNGYTVQPMSELLKAPQDQAKREKNTVGGVQFNRNTEGFARQNAGL